MKIVKVNIFDFGTSCHHGRFVVEASTGNVIEAFLARNENHRKGARYAPEDWGYVENILTPLYRRYTRLYKVQPNRWAYIKDYILDDPDAYWAEGAVGIYHC